jgi:hypothetical protein
MHTCVHTWVRSCECDTIVRARVALHARQSVALRLARSAHARARSHKRTPCTHASERVPAPTRAFGTHGRIIRT